MATMIMETWTFVGFVDWKDWAGISWVFLVIKIVIIVMRINQSDSVIGITGVPQKDWSSSASFAVVIKLLIVD